MATTTAAPQGSDDFANPVYMDEPASGNGAAGSPSLDDAVPILNLDDPNLLSEEMETSEENPYAIPPPLPDGRWLVKLKKRDVNGPDGQPAPYKIAQVKSGAQQGLVYAQCALDAIVIDPSGKYDGVELHDYRVTTIPNPRKGNSVPMKWILKCLKVEIPSRVSARVLLAEFDKALASEPQLEIDSAWEGNLSREDQERFKDAGEYGPSLIGQHRFPEVVREQVDPTNPTRRIKVKENLPDAKATTKLNGQTIEVNLHARPRINNYYPLGSAKASGVEYGPRK